MQQAKTLLGADKDYHLYYDENWQKGGEPIYCAHIDYMISDHLLTAKIRFYKTDDMESIFQMEIKEFLEVKKGNRKVLNPLWESALSPSLSF